MRTFETTLSFFAYGRLPNNLRRVLIRTNDDITVLFDDGRLSHILCVKIGGGGWQMTAADLESCLNNKVDTKFCLFL